LLLLLLALLLLELPLPRLAARGCGARHVSTRRPQEGDHRIVARQLPGSCPQRRCRRHLAVRAVVQEGVHAGQQVQGAK
jgi:hypothetical protein